LDHWIWDICYVFAGGSQSILEKFGVPSRGFSYYIFPEVTQFSNRGIPSWQKWRAVRPFSGCMGLHFLCGSVMTVGAVGGIFLFNMVDGRLPPTVGCGLSVFFLGVTSILKKKQRHQSSDIFAANFHLVIG